MPKEQPNPNQSTKTPPSGTSGSSSSSSASTSADGTVRSKGKEKENKYGDDDVIVDFNNKTENEIDGKTFELAKNAIGKTIDQYPEKHQIQAEAWLSYVNGAIKASKIDPKALPKDTPDQIVTLLNAMIGTAKDVKGTGPEAEQARRGALIECIGSVLNASSSHPVGRWLSNIANVSMRTGIDVFLCILLREYLSFELTLADKRDDKSIGSPQIVGIVMITYQVLAHSYAIWDGMRHGNQTSWHMASRAMFLTIALLIVFICMIGGTHLAFLGRVPAFIAYCVTRDLINLIFRIGSNVEKLNIRGAFGNGALYGAIQFFLSMGVELALPKAGADVLGGLQKDELDNVAVDWSQTIQKAFANAIVDANDDLTLMGITHQFNKKDWDGYQELLSFQETHYNTIEENIGNYAKAVFECRSVAERSALIEKYNKLIYNSEITFLDEKKDKYKLTATEEEVRQIAKQLMAQNKPLKPASIMREADRSKLPDFTVFDKELRKVYKELQTQRPKEISEKLIDAMVEAFYIDAFIDAYLPTPLTNLQRRIRADILAQKPGLLPAQLRLISRQTADTSRRLEPFESLRMTLDIIRPESWADFAAKAKGQYLITNLGRQGFYLLVYGTLYFLAPWISSVENKYVRAACNGFATMASVMLGYMAFVGLHDSKSGSQDGERLLLPSGTGKLAKPQAKEPARDPQGVADLFADLFRLGRNSDAVDQSQEDAIYDFIRPSLETHVEIPGGVGALNAPPVKGSKSIYVEGSTEKRSGANSLPAANMLWLYYHDNDVGQKLEASKVKKLGVARFDDCVAYVRGAGSPLRLGTTAAINEGGIWTWESIPPNLASLDAIAFSYETSKDKDIVPRAGIIARDRQLKSMIHTVACDGTREVMAVHEFALAVNCFLQNLNQIAGRVNFLFIVDGSAAGGVRQFSMIADSDDIDIAVQAARTSIEAALLGMNGRTQFDRLAAIYWDIQTGASTKNRARQQEVFIKLALEIVPNLAAILGISSPGKKSIPESIRALLFGFLATTTSNSTASTTTTTTTTKTATRALAIRVETATMLLTQDDVAPTDKIGGISPHGIFPSPSSTAIFWEILATPQSMVAASNAIFMYLSRNDSSSRLDIKSFPSDPSDPKFKRISFSELAEYSAKFKGGAYELDECYIKRSEEFKWTLSVPEPDFPKLGILAVTFNVRSEKSTVPTTVAVVIAQDRRKPDQCYICDARRSDVIVLKGKTLRGSLFEFLQHVDGNECDLLFPKASTIQRLASSTTSGTSYSSQKSDTPSTAVQQTKVVSAADKAKVIAVKPSNQKLKLSEDDILIDDSSMASSSSRGGVGSKGALPHNKPSQIYYEIQSNDDCTIHVANAIFMYLSGNDEDFWKQLLEDGKKWNQIQFKDVVAYSLNNKKAKYALAEASADRSDSGWKYAGKPPEFSSIGIVGITYSKKVLEAVKVHSIAIAQDKIDKTIFYFLDSRALYKVFKAKTMAQAVLDFMNTTDGDACDLLYPLVSALQKGKATSKSKSTTSTAQ